jgi:hypothetical protein
MGAFLSGRSRETRRRQLRLSIRLDPDEAAQVKAAADARGCRLLGLLANCY